MKTLIAQLGPRLQRARVQFHALPVNQAPAEQLVVDGKLLLKDTFLRLPPRLLDTYLDQGLELAALMRASLDQDNDAAIDAQICFVSINNSQDLNQNPRRRVRALAAPSEAFLMHGMLEEFAVCTEAIGDAQSQLGLTVKAGTSYQRALLICERLGLSQHLPRLLLKLGQVYKAKSIRGRVAWERARSFFEASFESLTDAPINALDRERIASACVIDGALCSVEDLFKKSQAQEVSKRQLRQGIHDARRDIANGMRLATQNPLLAEYVRLGEVNLLRLDEIENAVLEGMTA